MTAMKGQESSSRMRIWSVFPFESRLGTRLPKVLSKSFYVRPAKCAMLGSHRLWKLFGNCSAGRGEVFPDPWLSGLWDMGTVKAIVGFLVIIAAVYAGFQIIPPELGNYSFQDDLRNIAMVGGANAHQTDQEIIDSIIRN